MSEKTPTNDQMCPECRAELVYEDECGTYKFSCGRMVTADGKHLSGCRTPVFKDILVYKGPEIETSRGKKVSPGSIWYVVGYVDDDGYLLRQVKEGDDPASWEDELISDMSVKLDYISFFQKKE